MEADNHFSEIDGGSENIHEVEDHEENEAVSFKRISFDVLNPRAMNETHIAHYGAKLIDVPNDDLGLDLFDSVVEDSAADGAKGWDAQDTNIAAYFFSGDTAYDKRDEIMAIFKKKFEHSASGIPMLAVYDAKRGDYVCIRAAGYGVEEGDMVSTKIKVNE